LTVKATVLFDTPQREIHSIITQRMYQSVATSIVTGFATPDGVDTIAEPINARPQSLSTIIIGAATYSGFQALDNIHSAGVPLNRLYVHLGHTRSTGGKKNPFVRFHPMMHSKIYYMEYADGTACALIGSHNMTSFALGGLNGEAAVLLEGPSESVEFDKIRKHIDNARKQSVVYNPGMKASFSWWTREFIDGMRAEIKIPQDWNVQRTILIFATAAPETSLAVRDQIYFEIPAGIEHIDSFATETHLFIFDTVPQDPWDAIHRVADAKASYTCKTLGADNQQGNREVNADWRVENAYSPKIINVPGGIYRPNTPSGMQQVRVMVDKLGVDPYEYLFDYEKQEWIPVYSNDDDKLLDLKYTIPNADAKNKLGVRIDGQGWGLVKGLEPRTKIGKQSDYTALELVKPDSGTFLLVSLRRRRKDRETTDERQ